MPQRDRTGPQGQGPKTGRDQGKCGPKDGTLSPQDQGVKGSGRGAGRGKGQGAGRGAGRGSGRGAGQGRGNR